MKPSSAPPSIFDPASLAALRAQVKGGDKTALKAAAQQFEALFLQMVLKSMRDATPREGLFDSDQTRLYESLLDQQLAQVLSAKGSTGLAAVIERQLSRQDGASSAPSGEGLPLQPAVQPRSLEPGARPLDPYRIQPEAQPLPLQQAPAQGGQSPSAMPSAARQFIDRILPAAQDAGNELGVPAHYLVAHAALETGWGRSEPRYADGRPSYNVFGIKAGRGWTGATVDAVTTEYVDGLPQQRVERFRAYGSYGEAFADYARLLGSSRRYAAVVAADSGPAFARALQRAGYATDPDYATKLSRIMSSTTLKTAIAA